MSMSLFSSRDSDDAGRRILSLLKSTTFDMEEMRQMEKSLPPADGADAIRLFNACLLFKIT